MIDGGSVCNRCGTWYSGRHTVSNCVNVFEERLKNRDEQLKEIYDLAQNKADWSNELGYVVSSEKIIEIATSK